MSNIEQSFQSGKAEAEAECQAEHAVQTVNHAGAVDHAAESAVDHAGAAADSAQLQAHRAADAVQQTGEQAAQMTQDAVAAVKDAATGGN